MSKIKVGGEKVKGGLILLVALLIVIGLTSSSEATIITDTTLFYANSTDPGGDLVSYGGQYVNMLEYILDWVRWTHHFDFEPAAAEVLSGTLTLWLEDDPGVFGGDDLLWEFAFGWTESGEWDFGEVDTDEYSYAVSALALEDGAFTITLGSVGGDFYINKSELKIEYDPITQPIPEPTTMLLLGSGLLGLAVFGNIRRKRS